MTGRTPLAAQRPRKEIGSEDRKAQEGKDGKVRKHSSEIMSEARDAERRSILGGFAAAFLMAAGYRQYDIDQLGDLSDVGPQRIRELLSAKRQEQKRVFNEAKKARFGPLPGAKKPQRKVAHKRRT